MKKLLNNSTLTLGFAALAITGMLALPSMGLTRNLTNASTENVDANYMGHSPRHGMMRGYGANAQFTNLTPEQITLIQTQQEAFFTNTDALRKNHMLKQSELLAELQSVTPDDAKVQTLIQEAAKLQGELYAQQAKLRAELVKAGIPAAAASDCAAQMGFGGHRGMMGKGMMMQCGSNMQHGGSNNGMMHGGPNGGNMMHDGNQTGDHYYRHGTR